MTRGQASPAIPDDATSNSDVSVVIACYLEERWADTCEALHSVSDQDRPAGQVILVVDHNPALAARARSTFPRIDVVENLADRGAAGARNAGAAVARHRFLAFLDDDAVADPGWLSGLLAPAAELRVLGVGGPLKPLWSAPVPIWFPREFGWVVGASHVERLEWTQVRNVWAGNMLVRAESFRQAGGFRIDFTKVGNRARPEDTEFCLRLTARNPGTVWVHNSSAVAHHKVPIERSTFRFFVQRCFNEGVGKVELGGLLGWNLLTDEARYGTVVLPKAMLVHALSALHGDAGQARQLAAALVGTAAALVGASSALVRTGWASLGKATSRRCVNGASPVESRTRSQVSRRD